MSLSGGARPAAVAILAACLLAAAPAIAADWQAVERIKHYSVTGATGIALYEAIGARGPKLSSGSRAIGLMEYDLKWRRDYQAERPASAQAGQIEKTACVLRSAQPILTITYHLPHAKGLEDKSLAARWKAFADGIEAHERTHGAHVRDMVDAIIAATVGLTVENDPQCNAIRDRVLAIVKAEHAAYLARTRAFEADEMRDGGNVQRLVLGLVNGG